MGKSERIASYQEFWVYYVREHSNRLNRLMHFWGLNFAIIFGITGVVRGEWFWARPMLVSGYGIAWIGHYFVQKNRPATFKYPIWSLISDFRMWYRILRRKPLR